MRRFRGIFVPPAFLCAAFGLAGCTVYTRPAHYSATVRTGATVGVVDDTSYSIFHSELAPYGQWFDRPVCGRSFGRVWKPSPAVVGPDFVPYVTSGEWVPTDQGWVFEADWEFSPIVFHYGRWCHDSRHGWVWVPDTEWGAAWVEWRHGGGYVGWAPLPPPGISLSLDYFIFVDEPRFVGGRVTRYGLPPDRRIEAHRVTRPVQRVITHPSRGGVAWPAGPPVVEVRGADGRAPRPVHVVPPARGVQRVIVRPHPRRGDR
jgi:hypothetical protein